MCLTLSHKPIRVKRVSRGILQEGICIGVKLFIPAIVVTQRMVSNGQHTVCLSTVFFSDL